MHKQSYFLIALILGCGDTKPIVEPSNEDTSIQDTSSPTIDIDGDGDSWTEADGDCNDADSSVYPGAPELCNEIR